MIAILCTIQYIIFSQGLLRGRPPAALAPSQADSLACFASLACNTGKSPPLPRAAAARRGARSVANH